MAFLPAWDTIYQALPTESSSQPVPSQDIFIPCPHVRYC